MNFEQGIIPPINVIDPQSASNTSAPQDLEEGQVSQEDELTNESQLSTTAKVMHCFTLMTKPIYFVCGIIYRLFMKTKRFVNNNKIIALTTLALLFMFLRLSRIITVKAFFWLIFIPTFLILLKVIVNQCIIAQRNSRQLEIQRQQSLANARRSHVQNINERLMLHILLNSSPNHRLQTAAGTRVRLMQLEPDADNLQGTRMHIQLISQGILRLLAEFIEDQQLAQHRPQRNGLTDEQITSLPIEKYLIPLAGAEEETCSICIDEFKQEQNLRKLPCNHRFHISCVDEWLKLSNSCPNCKNEVIVGEQRENPAGTQP